MSKILIIEDDSDLREGLAFALELEGYETAQARTLRDAKALLEETPWDLLLLDCNLPDGSGFDLVAELHGVCATPVFMLTARNTEMDEVRSLELGVADYMSKPFSLAVLKARIRRILQAQTPSATVTSGGITIDRKAAKVFRGEEKIDLSKIEYQLLSYLVENREQAACSPAPSCSRKCGATTITAAPAPLTCTSVVCAQRSSAIPSIRSWSALCTALAMSGRARREEDEHSDGAAFAFRVRRLCVALVAQSLHDACAGSYA